MLAALASLFILMNCSMAQDRPAKDMYSPAVDGFNYTDASIESFSVNSIGGGPLSVSTETSGGGGTTCCYRLYPLVALEHPIKIQWSRYLNGKYRWCRKTVFLTGPIPADPTDLGVHFMPDGNIVVQAFHFFPDMKLSLKRFDGAKRRESGNIIHDEEVATCSDEQ